jgi:CheY-like chemotaxis protein
MKKVIIAEDVNATLEKEKSFLNRAGFRILPAASNEKALALHRSVKADLIIAKLTMPDMSGERLCSLIRDDEELRNVSLLIVSSGDETDLERCMQCRANAFISSPINTAVLLQEVHKLLHVAPRASRRIPVRVKLYGKSKGIPFTGYTENISTSGMLFRSAAPLFEGDTITCSFSLPDSTERTAKAEIVRVIGKDTEEDTNGYGIRFTLLSPLAVSAIESFCRNDEISSEKYR